MLVKGPRGARCQEHQIARIPDPHPPDIDLERKWHIEVKLMYIRESLVSRMPVYIINAIKKYQQLNQQPWAIIGLFVYRIVHRAKCQLIVIICLKAIQTHTFRWCFRLSWKMVPYNKNCTRWFVRIFYVWIYTLFSTDIPLYYIPCSVLCRHNVIEIYMIQIWNGLCFIDKRCCKIEPTYQMHSSGHVTDPFFKWGFMRTAHFSSPIYSTFFGHLFVPGNINDIVESVWNLQV